LIDSPLPRWQSWVDIVGGRSLRYTRRPPLLGSSSRLSSPRTPRPLLSSSTLPSALTSAHSHALSRPAHAQHSPATTSQHARTHTHPPSTQHARTQHTRTRQALIPSLLTRTHTPTPPTTTTTETPLSSRLSSLTAGPRPRPRLINGTATDKATAARPRQGHGNDHGQGHGSRSTRPRHTGASSTRDSDPAQLVTLTRA